MTSRRNTPKFVLAVSLFLVAGLLSGCGDEKDDAKKVSSKGKTTTTAAQKKAEAKSGPTDEYVNVSDPVENSFTVDVPKGWDSVAYSNGEFDVHREVVTTVSPDGDTAIFLGDPKIPNYWSPNTGNPVIADMAAVLDFMELEEYRAAETYFPEYAERKYGQLPDFEITNVEENERLTQGLKAQFVQAGLPEPDGQVVDLFFSYKQGSKKMTGLLVGVTIDSGSFWQADVSGLSTDGDVEEYRPMLSKMSLSKKTNPEWQAKWQAQQNANVAQQQANWDAMNRQHANNMAAIQASASRHQSRMDAIHAAGDASMQNYYSRMDSMDNNQRSFLNYVNEENTVSSGGTTRQVDSGYQTYYVNKNDNTYVGGDINFGDSQIRSLGLNPNDFELAKVVR